MPYRFLVGGYELLNPRERLIEAILDVGCGRTTALVEPHRVPEIAVGIFKDVETQGNAVARKNRLEATSVSPELPASASIGVLAHRLAIRKRKHVGKEHRVVVSPRFEDQNVTVGVSRLISGEPGAHPGVNNGSEGLREYGGQTPVGESTPPHDAELDRADGVHRNDWIHTENQISSGIESHRGVDGFQENAVDVVAAVDLNGWVEPGKGGGCLNRFRDGDVVETGLSEADRAARIEIGGDHYELSLELAEVVAPPWFGEDLFEVNAEWFVAENTDGEGSGKPTERFQEPTLGRVSNDLPQTFEEELRDFDSAADKFTDSWGKEGLGHKWVLSRFGLDDGAAHLGGREIVCEAR